jgi:ATP-dependent DNA helicase PIF1
MNTDQQLALNYIKNGFNIFLGGSAGTGKSYTINKIVEYCQNKGKSVAITASTGIAASSINGRTLHSFASAGLGKADVEKLIPYICSKRDAYNRWRNTDILIIDEISMLDYKFIIKLEKIARNIRRNDKVFGGMQLLLSGDFAQLPPVNVDKYLFESEIWNKIVDKSVILSTIYRQTDAVFTDLLARVRIGKTTNDDVKLFSKTKNLISNTGIIPTKLYCTRKDVDRMNTLKLKELNHPLFENEANDWYKTSKHEYAYKSTWQMKEKLQLKIDSQVMLLTNTYYNEDR